MKSKSILMHGIIYLVYPHIYFVQFVSLFILIDHEFGLGVIFIQTGHIEFCLLPT